MPLTEDSKRRVGEAIAEYFARDLFATTLGPSPSYDADDPAYLRHDVLTWCLVWFKQPEHDDLDEGIAHLPDLQFEYEYDADLNHPNVNPPDAMARAHMLRIAHGWGYSTALHDYLKSNPHLLSPMGFDTIPRQSTLHRGWNRFSDEHQEAIREATIQVVGAARNYDVPAPSKVFRPQQELEQQGPTPSKRELTVRQAEQTWEHGKSIFKDNFSLKRGPNASIPEFSFWHQHAKTGLEGSCAHDGARGFDYSNLDSPSGWQHRRELQKLTEDEVRESVRGTARDLIERAQRKSKLQKGVTVGIDTTKGRRHFVGEIERDEDGNNVEPWILGYKDEGDYFQYATVQIVGDDVPIVLDVLPVKRGMTRARIVDELLKEAKHLIRIDEVQMDREFENPDTIGKVEKHGMVYRTPVKRTPSLRAKCTELRRKGAKAHIIEEGGIDGGSPRKIVFVPAHNTDVFERGDDVEPEDDEEDKSLQQELVEDFSEVSGTDIGENERMFSDFLEEVKEEEKEQPIRGSDADVEAYAIFQTNDPSILVDDLETEQDTIEAAARAVYPYKRRWAIEEGNKKIKEFEVKSTSRDYEYRFFNFAFATCMYNMWRIVDLLVQLSMEEEYDFSPSITSKEFLNCAKENFSFDRPPPAPAATAV